MGACSWSVAVGLELGFKTVRVYYRVYFEEGEGLYSRPREGALQERKEATEVARLNWLADRAISSQCF